MYHKQLNGSLTFFGENGNRAILSAARLINQEANARRIVACWNACEGLDTGMLENITTLGDTLASRFRMRDKVERDLQAQRDDLLEFVKEWLGRQGTDENYMVAKARAAIAKATAQQ